MFIKHKCTTRNTLRGVILSDNSHTFSDKDLKMQLPNLVDKQNISHKFTLRSMQVEIQDVRSNAFQSIGIQYEGFTFHSNTVFLVQIIGTTGIGQFTSRMYLNAIVRARKFQYQFFFYRATYNNGLKKVLRYFNNVHCLCVYIFLLDVLKI